MVYLLILCGVVVLLCVASSKLLGRFGMPTLLAFLLLGMLFGAEGPFHIQQSMNFDLAKQLCSFGLIFIMFYGGFGTSWKSARPVAAQAVLLSTLGVLITAGVTGVFCHFVFGISWLESLLLGAVISSTDAASVFSILRGRNLNLKGGLASLLEIESGSNDPISYMLTILFLMLLNGAGPGAVPLMVLRQLAFGLLVGVVLGLLASYVLHRIDFEISGMDTILVFGVAVLAYALAEWLGGNGYLSVYLAGIILGNHKILHKRALVHFFDGVSWLMQIMLFFTLGFVSRPSALPGLAIYAVPVALCLIFLSRPLAVFSILSWFKVPLKQQLFVSFVGLRGAASIVFAILAATGGQGISDDIFHIVFFVALFSVALQGSVLPLMAKKLDLLDGASPVLKTFTDYAEDENTHLFELEIGPGHPYLGKTIAEVQLCPDILIIMIKRGGETIIPNGGTRMQEGDVLVELFRRGFYNSVCHPLGPK